MSKSCLTDPNSYDLIEETRSYWFVCVYIASSRGLQIGECEDVLQFCEIFIPSFACDTQYIVTKENSRRCIMVLLDCL